MRALLYQLFLLEITKLWRIVIMVILTFCKFNVEIFLANLFNTLNMYSFRGNNIFTQNYIVKTQQRQKPQFCYISFCYWN